MARPRPVLLRLTIRGLLGRLVACLAWFGLAGFVAGRLGFVMDLLRAASALLCAKMYPNPYNLPRLRRGLLLMYLTLNHAGV